MKLLLTSAGITNTSIRTALLELLGRPIAECRALLISTASYPLRGGPELAWSFTDRTPDVLDRCWNLPLPRATTLGSRAGGASARTPADERR